MKPNDESGIDYHKGGTTIYGEDGIKFYRAALLASSIEMWCKCRLLPTRGVTITMMLEQATAITGKKYRRRDAVQAVKDVREWTQAMKAALPKTEDGKPIP